MSLDFNAYVFDRSPLEGDAGEEVLGSNVLGPEREWPFRLDMVKRELFLHGKPCGLATKAKLFDLLAHLLSNAGMPIKKNDLIQVMYPDEAGDRDARLRGLLDRLYEMLEDNDRDNPRYIDRKGGTIWFIGEVQPPTPRARHHPRQSAFPTDESSELKALDLVAGAFYHIISRSTNLSIDVPRADPETGEPVHLWTVPGWVNNQRWQLLPADRGYQVLLAKHSKKCLDVREASRENGTRLMQYAPEFTRHQQWRIKQTPQGFYLLAARHSDQVLDRDDLGFCCGAKLQMWDPNGWPNQDWDLVREDHLLVRHHFLIDSFHLGISEPQAAGAAYLRILSLLTELRRRRATFFSWFQLAHASDFESSVMSDLCLEFPESFGQLPPGIGTEHAAAIAAMANPAATIVTSELGAVKIERIAASLTARTLIADSGNDQLRIPALDLVVGGGALPSLTDILRVRLTHPWDTWQATKGVQWRKVRSGEDLPEGALQGGCESDGTPLYVGRAHYLGGLHPGKIVNGVCHFPHGAEEILAHDFEVPVVSAGEWGVPEPGCASALIGGYEGGNALAVCRVPWEGGLHPGKVVSQDGICSYGGRERVSGEFEVFNIPR